MICFYFLCRLCKRTAMTTISQALASTPFQETPSAPQCSQGKSPWIPETPLSTSENSNAIDTYNAAINEIALLTPGVSREPLPFQLKIPWEEAREDDKKKIIKKASEDCLLVCKAIAPESGDKLFESLEFSKEERIDRPPRDDLVILMTAYKNASSKNLKKQILSLYAFRYPAKTLQAIHSPYGKLSNWQIKQARSHAKIYGPGTVPVSEKKHRVRLDMKKVDHFVEFANRPHFYQDVAYGNKILKLDSGEKIQMPNVVRTVARSTMINQYFEFCKEEQFEPLSRSTLFKILDVREASQRKSLQGLDNIAADGAAGFQTAARIIDDLEKGGGNKQWCNDAKRRLRDSKQYLKTDYPVHCKPDESTCADHCRKFALSDNCDPDFQVVCTHQHIENCDQCQTLKAVLDEVEAEIRSSSWNPYNQEHREDLLYDFERARSDIQQWKAHVLRSINQDEAKQDVLKMEDSSSALIVMDWAMKFLQLKYRERQCDWYGKRGLSWHISTVISFNASSEGLQLKSYAHLFDSCQQDWFAVCSILENLLKAIKTENPEIESVYLRSDGAGCYHNNSLIAAVTDIGERIGVRILRYDFSEPQHGKDVCDRILCPMKASIRRYCNEGHDILSADDMRRALSERFVKGTSACVCLTDVSKKTLDVQSVEGLSSYHNFAYETNGMRVWKSYGIGPGKLIPFDGLFRRHQSPTDLVVVRDFFPFKDTRLYKSACASGAEKEGIFPCPETGCQMTFEKFGDLEAHLDVGNHNPGKPKMESTFDKLRREWAQKFSTVDQVKKSASADRSTATASTSAGSRCELPLGWALQSPRRGATRFSNKVKEYLTAKFDIGEKTGDKADPMQVASDMRSAKDDGNSRLFTREEWLTKNQVKGFFSRLATGRRRRRNEDIDINDAYAEKEEEEREKLLADIASELSPQHPIFYDTTDLCKCVKEDKLQKFNVTMLKTILLHFDVAFNSKDRKKDLVQKMSSFVQECNCFLSNN